MRVTWKCCIIQRVSKVVEYVHKIYLKKTNKINEMTVE